MVLTLPLLSTLPLLWWLYYRLLQIGFEQR